jgi:ABC-type branched-subunit amino acid transport system substrate-binding protein
MDVCCAERRKVPVPAATGTRRAWLAAAVALPWVAPRIARAEPGVGASELLIGQSITLQGGQNAYGTSVLAGMALALEAANASGGVNGRRLVLRTLDDQNSTATATANARQLVDQGAFLLFGPIEGGPSTVVAEVAAERSVPLFGPLAGSPGLRRPHQPMVFPVRAEHRVEFRALLDWGQRTGLRSVAFVHSDSPVGQAHLANVKLLCTELQMRFVHALPLPGNATDAALAPLVATLAAQPVDMAFNHGSAGVYQRLITKARGAGSRCNFMGINSGSSQLAAALGPAARGMVFTQVVPSPWERKREITREYQDAARRADPQAAFGYGHLEGYVTAKALLLALRAAGRDLTRAAFVRTLHGLNADLGGMKIRYAAGDHEGSRFVDLSIVTEDGRFVH